MTINIKPENRGKLHKALHVKEGEKIPASKLKIKESDSSSMKKMKQFALNSRKWNKQLGGLSELGYSDDSPYKDYPYIPIQGNNITMAQTGKHLTAIPLDEWDNILGIHDLPPYSGEYEFEGANKVLEIPKGQRGGNPNKLSTFERMLNHPEVKEMLKLQSNQNRGYLNDLRLKELESKYLNDLKRAEKQFNRINKNLPTQQEPNKVFVNKEAQLKAEKELILNPKIEKQKAFQESLEKVIPKNKISTEESANLMRERNIQDLENVKNERIQRKLNEKIPNDNSLAERIKNRGTYNYENDLANQADNAYEEAYRTNIFGKIGDKVKPIAKVLNNPVVKQFVKGTGVGLGAVDVISTGLRAKQEYDNSEIYNILQNDNSAIGKKYKDLISTSGKWKHGTESIGNFWETGTGDYETKMLQEYLKEKPISSIPKKQIIKPSNTTYSISDMRRYERYKNNLNSNSQKELLLENKPIPKNTRYKNPNVRKLNKYNPDEVDKYYANLDVPVTNNTTDNNLLDNFHSHYDQMERYFNPETKIEEPNLKQGIADYYKNKAQAGLRNYNTSIGEGQPTPDDLLYSLPKYQKVLNNKKPKYLLTKEEYNNLNDPLYKEHYHQSGDNYFMNDPYKKVNNNNNNWKPDAVDDFYVNRPELKSNDSGFIKSNPVTLQYDNPDEARAIQYRRLKGSSILAPYKGNIQLSTPVQSEESVNPYLANIREQRNAVMQQINPNTSTGQAALAGLYGQSLNQENEAVGQVNRNNIQNNTNWLNQVANTRNQQQQLNYNMNDKYYNDVAQLQALQDENDMNYMDSISNMSAKRLQAKNRFLGTAIETGLPSDALNIGDKEVTFDVSKIPTNFYSPKSDATSGLPQGKIVYVKGIPYQQVTDKNGGISLTPVPINKGQHGGMSKYKMVMKKANR